jgi:HAD superfamily hydrolase (TIGR01459 family)
MIMPMVAIQQVHIDRLVERYGVILLDAYGVLVNAEGALPGAVALLELLKRRGKGYFVLTNDATKPPDIAAQRYQGFGLPIDPAQIISSGSLLTAHFHQRGLTGKAVRVLGPSGSRTYARAAGGVIAQGGEPFEVLVVADQEGFPFLETVDDTLTALFARVDAGLPVHLVLPNPDLIYPSATGYGITSGSIALLLESALRLRYPGRDDLRFTVLGKPQPGLFREALNRCPGADMVMIGDQLATDIAGANAAGLASALLLGGVSAMLSDFPEGGPRPDYVLATLDPSR